MVDRRPHDPWAHLAHGWALLCWERFAAARPALERARDGFDAQAEAAGLRHCALGLLALDQRAQARPQLDEAFAVLAERCAAAGDHAAALQSRIEQARQLNLLQRPAEAEALLADLASLGGLRPVDAGRIARARAYAASLQGDQPRAHVLLAKAERWFRMGSLRIDRARCWVELAAAETRQERFAAAARRFEAARRVFERADLPLQLAFCMRGSGLVAMRQGQYDRALRETLGAVAYFKAVDRRLEVMTCAKNIGNIHYYTGRWDAALATYTRVEEELAAAGYLGETIGTARNRALVYRALGDHNAARRALAHASSLAAARGLASELAEILSIQAGLLGDEGKTEAARQLYEQARGHFIEQRNAAAAAECRLEQGWLELSDGAAERARRHFAAAAPALASQPHHLWRALYGLGRSAEAMGESDEALTAYAEASMLTAALRTRLASEQASSGIFAKAADLHAHALRLAHARGDLPMLLSLIEGQRALSLRRLAAAPGAPPSAEQTGEEASLRRRITSLLESGQAQRPQLDAALAEYGDLLLRRRHSVAGATDVGALLPDGPLDVAALRVTLCERYGDDWTALVYSFADGALRVVWLTASEIGAVARPADRALLRLIDQASLPKYRHYTYGDVAFEEKRASMPWAPLVQLGDALLPAPVRERLHPGHRLLIVPAGPLHVLPWAALRLGDAWLIERAVVQLLPALSVAPALAARAPGGDGGLFVGCGVFAQQARPLPGVPEELRSLAARWPGAARVLQDAAASVDAVCAAVTRERGRLAVLHIASHARQLPERGMAAHIKLWDDNLLLPDLAALSLEGALVVLSACEGAAADVLAGEEVFSLSWGLLAAGASGVAASLWPLDDVAAGPLMEALYDGLAATGDLGLALAQAQRRALKGHRAARLAPQVWGSFVVTGG
jgi:hypothetical protein